MSSATEPALPIPVATPFPAKDAAASHGTGALAVTRASLHVRSVGPSNIDSGQFASRLQREGVLDLLALGETTETLGYNGSLVDEHVAAAIPGLDEAVTLDAVEPEDIARRPLLLRHVSDPIELDR